jgi:crotonobetainyl-CoA:carnitine CoA-transferase CaiB-like acyl-CoA transferase
LERRSEVSEAALSNVKVLDLTHYIAGPYCTKLLADYGAEVVKIEKPGEGDGARRMGPFLNDEPHPEKSGLFLYLNNNKKSITLNLKTDTGAKIFKELVKEADVVVENFSPGVMSRLGLDYAALDKINPRLVMTSISNFGQDGPYRDYKSAHIVGWAMAGWRYTDGLPGRPPVQPGGWLTHYVAGLYGAVGTMGALNHQDETGIGQHVDISLWEALLLIAPYHTVMYAYSGMLHQPLGRAYVGIVPCKDGYIGINCFNQPQWELLCKFMGMPQMLEDSRFATFGLMALLHVDEAIELITPWAMERTKDEIFHSGQEWRVPTGLVPTSEEILSLAQFQARDFFVEVDHPKIGKVTQPGAPFKMSETPWQMRRAAPLLGEHNDEFYGELGYSKEDLVRLREQCII